MKEKLSILRCMRSIDENEVHLLHGEPTLLQYKHLCSHVEDMLVLKPRAHFDFAQHSNAAREYARVEGIAFHFSYSSQLGGGKTPSYRRNFRSE